MKKSLLFLLAFFVTMNVLWAQVGTPTYFNVVPTTATNAFPWNSTTSNKVQWIYAPGAFTTAGGGAGTPAPSGQAISKIYIRIQTVNATNTYTPDFAISLTQSGTANTFASGTYFTGLTTVFQSSSFQFTGIVAGSWYGFTCSTPFPYDPTQSLIVECKSNVAIAGGNAVNSIGTTGLNQRIYGAYASASGTAGTGLTPCGIDLISLTPCSGTPTAGTVASTSSTVCPNTNFLLTLSGSATGSGLTYQWDSSANGTTWVPIAGATNQSYTGSQTSSYYYRCNVTCSSNTATTPSYLMNTNAVPLAGTYTLNNTLPASSTNFISFTSLAAALNCAGVSAPVIVNVAAGTGPYTEQIVINQIPGASATNTVTINGNNQKITFAPTVIGAPSTVELNGTDYLTINNLEIEATGTTYAFACHLWNGANNNNFNGCKFLVPTTVTVSTSSAFSVSGAQASATTAGLSGINNVVDNCEMTGGYYCCTMVGNSTANATGNKVLNSKIQEFYFYGSYNLYQTGVEIGNCLIQRPTRITSSTFYGVYVSTGSIASNIHGNVIKNPFTTAPTTTSAAYCIYVLSDGTTGSENKVYNNIISDIEGNGVAAGLYLTGADYVQAYHNTISLDNTTATAGTTYGIYSTGTVGGIDIKNNIVSITRGGSGAKYCLYYSTAFPTSNNNVLYLNSAAGTNYIAYANAVTYATLPLYQAGTSKDLNSIDTNPAFTSASDFTPTSSSVNNMGTGVGILTDINNASRSLTSPDPGAIEFALAAVDVAFVNIASPTTASGCYSAAETFSTNIQNAGIAPLDFSVTPMTITLTVTGATTATLTAVISTGTLAVNATTAYTLTPTLNMLPNGTYTVSGTVSVTGDGNLANNNLASLNYVVGPNAGTITSSLPSICVSGTPTITVAGASGGTKQWKESTVSATGPWTNVGTGGNTYTPSSAITQTTYYMMEVSCNSNIVTSNVDTVIVNNPQITSTTPDTICANNSATLSATAAGGATLNWFSSPSATGTPLYVGSPFNTPTLTSSTTYYVAASNGGVPTNGSLLAGYAGGNGSSANFFDVIPTVNMLLTGVDLNCSSTLGTSVTVQVWYRNSTVVGNANTTNPGWTLLTSGTTLSAGTGNPTNFTFPVGVNLPMNANTTYGLAVGFTSGSIQYTNATAGAAVAGTTWASNSDLVIKCGYGGTFTSSIVDRNVNGRLYYTTNPGCASATVPVIATVNPAPTVTATPSNSTVCQGAQITLTASGSTATYSWSGGITDNTPFVPTASQTYTVTATDATGCTNSATSSIIVNPVLTGIASVSPTAICLGQTATFTTSLAPQCALTSVSGFQGTYAPANWSNLNTNSNGTVNAALAPASITMTSGTNNSNSSGNTNYSKAIGCSGTVSFNWSYSTADFAFADYPTYSINGGTSLTFPGFNTSGASSQTGTASIAVSAGDIITLQAFTLDNDGTPGTIVISNFSAPAPPITGTASFWDAASGGTNLNTSTIVSTPTTAGPLTYYAEYTATATGCANLVRTPVTLDVHAIPTVSATATPTTICSNGTSQLSSTVSGVSLSAGPQVQPGTYCAAGSSQDCSFGDEYISNVTVGTINSSSICGSTTYTDNTSMVTTMSAGNSYAISVTNPNYFFSDQCIVWIDFNRNGLFTDANEMITLSGGSSSTPFTGNIVIPGSAVPGLTTMRVRMMYSGTPSPCGNTSYGEVEDYSVNLLAPVVTYSWSPATDLNSTTISDVTYTSTTSGTATYTVTVADALGCSNTSSVSVTTNPPPTGNTFANPIIAGTLPYSTTNNNLASNCWTSDYTGANSQSSPDVFYQFTMPSCHDSVYINLCTGTTFDSYIHILDNTGTQIDYSDDDCGSNPELFVGGLTPSATYYVVVEGYGSNTGTFGLSINSYQTPNVMAISTSATTTTICENSTTQISATSVPATTFTWMPGSLSGASQIVNPAATTTYTVTASNATCSDIQTITVTVNSNSGNLCLSSSNDAISNTGISTNTQTQNDATNLSYYDNSCNLIATVNDGAGGNVLGLTTATSTVEASVLSYNGQPYSRRWFQITPTNNGPATVTLYLTHADFTDYNAANGSFPDLPTTGSNSDPNIPNIRITKVDGVLGTGTPTVIIPTMNWNSVTNYWEASFPVTSFSQFYFHSVNPNNVPLPVVISNFKGQKTASTDLLTWTTSNEMNNAYFNLLYSTNGKDFATIGKINSKAQNGNSQQELNYRFENATPALGHNYYQLEQVDLDGKTSKSTQIVDLIWGANGSTASVYPNPASDNLNIDLYVTKAQNTTIKLLDMSGRVVKQIQARSSVGMNKLTVDISSIATGLYTVQIYENDNLTQVSKVRKN